MKCVLPTTIEIKRPLAYDALEPALSKLIEPGPPETQHLTGLLLAYPMIIKGVQDLFHEALGQTKVLLQTLSPLSAFRLLLVHF
jgi:hypothetical protein